MSTRDQRRDWQEFREKHGETLAQFKKKWRAMFGRMPNDAEVEQYRQKRAELRAPLGRKKRMDKEPQVTVTRSFKWDMAHRLPNHGGKCRRLHGHRYLAEIDVTGPIRTSGSSQGMVIDFGDLDKIIDDVIGFWDHRTMLFEGDNCLSYGEENMDLHHENEVGIFRVPFHPTAENIARHVLTLLTHHFRKLLGDVKHCTVTRVRIYETPTGWAEARL